MTAPADPVRLRRIQEQFDRVRAAFREDPDAPGIEVSYQANDAGEPQFYHQDCAMLVREDQVGFARAHLGAELDPSPDACHEDGMRMMTLREPGARNAIEAVRREAGEDLDAAAYNHVLSVAPAEGLYLASNGGGNLCPADEPDRPDDPRPTPSTGQGAGAGERVRVLVIDTGLLPDAAEHEWLATGVVGGPNRAGRYDDSRTYRGHGTFVAGVLRCVAPAVSVEVDNRLYRAGALTECDLRQALGAVLDSPDPPEVVSLSAGGYFERNTCGPGLRAVVQGLRDLRARIGRPVLVAAAGNDGRAVPTFLPAGLPGVISVGALRHDLTARACFSNHGRCVDVYAPGERLVNAFITGPYTYVHERRDTCQFIGVPGYSGYPGCTCVDTPPPGTTKEFSGLGTWSGTSFATPVVAGLIAARISRARSAGAEETAKQAAAWVLNHAETIDGGLRVLRPDHDLG